MTNYKGTENIRYPKCYAYFKERPKCPTCHWRVRCESATRLAKRLKNKHKYWNPRVTRG